MALISSELKDGLPLDARRYFPFGVVVVLGLR